MNAPRMLPLQMRALGRRPGQGRPCLRGRAHHHAAYAAGDNLEFEGEIYNFRGRARRQEVHAAGLHFPRHVRRVLTRQELWDTAERAEKRRDARVARAVTVALPNDLDDAGRTALLRRFVAGIAEPLKVPVDWAIHCPPDPATNNWHAHLTWTTRVMSVDGELGEKTRFELRDRDARERGLQTPRQLLDSLRQFYARCCEEALDAQSRPHRVDLRSYKRQGLDLEPQRHLGAARCRRVRQGLEVPVAKENEAIRARNAARAEARRRQEQQAQQQRADAQQTAIARRAWEEQLRREDAQEAAAFETAVPTRPSEGERFGM